ncbi:uncharacterized protein LOC128965586 [Oppia nitens]|uniref:uncharacterized protein LOC128965586 n=1 Tax=Oppia nitens TaxID=1686743 RepID=UPI0023DB581C|nr:uncharacterized protein LOC128965586 [Oppia nitens]
MPIMAAFGLNGKCVRLVANSWTRFQCKRHLFGLKRSKPGIYVLFPDIPSDTSETNELLRIPINDSVTNFSKLSAEKCVKAISKMSIEFEWCINSLEQRFDEKNFDISLDETIQQIEDRLVSLDYGLSTLRTLKNVDKNTFGFKYFNQFFSRIQELKIRRFLSQPIYYYMREINSNRDKLNNQQKKIVDKYLLESKLFGANLSTNELSALNEIHKELSEEKTKYKYNLTEATKRFSHAIDDPALLQVLPDELIASIGSHSNATVTLHSSVFNPFMEYCPDRLLRWNLWIAYNSRGSPLNDSRLSNSVCIEKIRGLRRNEAQVLGYDNYVELSMETKMARNLENVKNFITTLHSKSKLAFDANLKELNEFARNSGSFDADKVELWDLPYWQRKLLKSTYDIEDTTVKQYFTTDSVFNGLFNLAERLFNIKIEEVMKPQFNGWHEDVRLFRILSPNTGIVASFLLDPYSRLNSKKNMSYVELALNHCHSQQTKPMSFFITNFDKPLVKGQSTQLSFSQIIILFKQFGLILQNSLTDIKYNEISGLANLEWDVIHFMSEFFALWPLNSYAVISSCSSHVTDGSPFPEQEFDKIRKAHYHFASFDFKHEIYKMTLDLALYSSKEFWLNIKDEVWDEYMTPFTRDKLDTHPCSFKAIFSDEFPAAYYTHKWAQMLASDTFQAFQDSGLDDQNVITKVGDRFKEAFLIQGNSYNSEERFRKFLGRDPSPDALLKINGLYGHQSHHKRDHTIGNDKVNISEKSKII